MRILLVNPKSPHSFWTLDQTVRSLGKKSAVIPLGLATVAALLPQEWEFKIVDRQYQEIPDDLWNWAEMILLTGMMVHGQDMLTVISEANRRGKGVVVGGPYASLLPDELVAAGASFVITGEGESAIPVWLKALSNGASGGIIREDGKPDLTRSPVPRFDLLDLDAYAMAAVQTSRGCPFDCEFCDIATLYGNKQRHKTADQVMEELIQLHALGWRGSLLFSDDNFIGSKKHARAVLEKLIPWMKQHGQPFHFWTQTSVTLGHDLELIDLMTEANFGFVFLGIETPEEDVLRQARKAHNLAKPLDEAVRAINANGLSIVGSFIIGFDGEKTGAGDNIRAFVEKTNLPLVMVNTLQALPHTLLWERLKQEGRLLPQATSSLRTGSTMNFVPTRPQKEIMEEMLQLSLHLYDPSRYMERAYNFYLTMRPTRRATALREGRKPQREVKLSRDPRRRHPVKDLLLFLSLVWTHGIIAPYRGQFWRQMVGIYKRNPSRLVAYLNSIGIGNNMFHLRSVIQERVRSETAGAGPR